MTQTLVAIGERTGEERKLRKEKEGKDEDETEMEKGRKRERKEKRVREGGSVHKKKWIAQHFIWTEPNDKMNYSHQCFVLWI